MNTRKGRLHQKADSPRIGKFLKRHREKRTCWHAGYASKEEAMEHDAHIPASVGRMIYTANAELNGTP